MTDNDQSQTWTLDDAEERARKHPYTFWKPSHQLTEKIRPGDLVKLIFVLTERGPDDPHAERMWVEVTEVTDQGFVGTLDNIPQYIPDFEHGTIIEFESRHIIDSNLDDPVPDPTLEWQARCFVTNRILVDGEGVGFFYREEPDREEDSGWRFMCGDESNEYLDSSENFQLVSLGALLSCDDAVLPFLDTPPPAAFERDPRSESFQECEPPPER